MSHYLARLKAIVSKKHLQREPSKPSKGAFEPFEGSGDTRVSKFDVEAKAFDGRLSTASALPPVVASLEQRRAAVDRLLAGMAADYAARREWWHAPVDGWREGRLTIHDNETGRDSVILLRKPNKGRSDG